MTINITQVEDAAGALEQNTVTVMTGFEFWAADEAREQLIKQLGNDMLAAAKAGDMAKAKQLKDLMYAEINHRSLEFKKRRHAEIDLAIGMTTTIGQSHEERLDAVKVVE